MFCYCVTHLGVVTTAVVRYFCDECGREPINSTRFSCPECSEDVYKTFDLCWVCQDTAATKNVYSRDGDKLHERDVHAVLQLRRQLPMRYWDSTKTKAMEYVGIWKAESACDNIKCSSCSEDIVMPFWYCIECASDGTFKQNLTYEAN